MNESSFSLQYPRGRESVPKGLPMIIALQGFSDAGNAVVQLDEFLGKQQDPQVILQFKNDIFLDYRARRPKVTFEEDHLTGYAPSKLQLSITHDQLGAPFLMLTGYEPDFRWEKFIDEVLEIVNEHEVSVTVWTHAIPMPVPHTRPIGTTVSGTREDLIEARSIWRPTTKLAASASHGIEFALHQAGHEVVGFALLVPHYLANTEYPQVLLTSLESIMAATGLMFGTADIVNDGLDFAGRVDEQIKENEESTEMVKNLEGRYDDFMRKHLTEQPPFSIDEELIPSAEQLATELERFLAEQRDKDIGKGFTGPESTGKNESDE